MKIGKYKVRWESYGWSYMRPMVYMERKRRFWFGFEMVKVWMGDTVPCEEYRVMKSKKYMALTKGAVSQYEEYKKDWDEFNERTHKEDSR